MRKFILLAGTALTLSAMPAAACDLELMGGPQRFNAFAAYASHGSPAVTIEVTQPQTDSPDTSEPQPEATPQPAEPPAEAESSYAERGQPPFTTLP